jgi:hypothetical protein
METAALVLVPGLILIIPLDGRDYVVSENVHTVFQQSGFQHLIRAIGNFFGTSNGSEPRQFLFSDTGVRIQIFIAFAYLYHYLNWFSKVSLIGWLKSASHSRIGVLIFIWIISIGLYVYDYTTGLRALFLLSLLHVTMEFPLNVISIKEISSRLFKV